MEIYLTLIYWNLFTCTHCLVCLCSIQKGMKCIHLIFQKHYIFFQDIYEQSLIKWGNMIPTIHIFTRADSVSKYERFHVEQHFWVETTKRIYSVKQEEEKNTKGCTSFNLYLLENIALKVLMIFNNRIRES